MDEEDGVGVRFWPAPVEEVDSLARDDLDQETFGLGRGIGRRRLGEPAGITRAGVRVHQT
jgi:hypothetical protein